MSRLIRFLIDHTIVKLVKYVNAKTRNTPLENNRIYRHNLHAVLWERAIVESADFVQQHIGDVLVFITAHDIWDFTIQKIQEQTIDGACLEFGVFRGTSINYFAKRLRDQRFIGFDSFEGLAEDWKGHHAKRGTFDLKGTLPAVESNVQLIKGWFDRSVPEYFRSQFDDEKIRFVHMDADTFESTVIVLEQIAPYLRPGVLIMFDEYIGYPNWKNGEYRAWQNLAAQRNIKFRYRGFCSRQALIEIAA